MKSPEIFHNRQPAVAGQFYPSNPDELRRTLKNLFAGSPQPETYQKVRAVISPHAGYIFSGEVAAAAFSSIDPEKVYKTVFLIGSSHRNSFAGASVYSIGNYITPLGIVGTDFETAENMVKENHLLAHDPQLHKAEHCIEVQIPFLQFHLKKEFKIVPILLGTHDEQICEKIAAALKPYFIEENLFVISTDFSHYPEYDDAVKTDKMIAEAIADNNPEKFLTAVKSCLENKIPQLSTGCCSWPSVITLMYLTEKNPGLAYKSLLYKNSGDSVYGEKDSVVGYWALNVYNTGKAEQFLSEPDKKLLLQSARKTLQDYLGENRRPGSPPESIPPSLNTKAGAFVTLKKNGELRGCIGSFKAENSIYKTVQQMAIAAATQDYRFPRVTFDELIFIEIEISILTPMVKITDLNTIRLGTDGIYIRKGERSGTFLPQVATETGWNLNEFVSHCARDKAGIGWDGWKDKDAEIFIYQAIIFGDRVR